MNIKKQLCRYCADCGYWEGIHMGLSLKTLAQIASTIDNNFRYLGMPRGGKLFGQAAQEVIRYRMNYFREVGRTRLLTYPEDAFYRFRKAGRLEKFLKK